VLIVDIRDPCLRRAGYPQIAHARYQLTHRPVRSAESLPHWLPATFAQPFEGLITLIIFNLVQNL